MNQDDPHKNLLDWTNRLADDLQKEGGARSVCVDVLQSAALSDLVAPYRDRLLGAYADHNWNEAAGLISKILQASRGEIESLPPQIREERERVFTSSQPIEKGKIYESERRVQQSGAPSRRKFIQEIVVRYARQYSPKDMTNPALLEQGRKSILSTIDLLPEDMYARGSTAEIMAEVNRRVVERCVGLGLSSSDVTALLEGAAPLIESRRKAEKELVESVLSSHTPDATSRSLSEDLELGVDPMNPRMRARILRKARGFETLENIQQQKPLETNYPKDAAVRSFSRLAQWAGKPTGLQAILGDAFAAFGSDSTFSKLTERSAMRVMQQLAESPQYESFVRNSMSQMRLQEDKRPLSGATQWLSNVSTDLLDSVFRGPMDEAMETFLKHQSGTGELASIGKFKSVFSELIAPSPVFIGGGPAAAGAGTAGAAGTAGLSMGSVAVGGGGVVAGGSLVGASTAGAAAASGAAAGAAAGSVVPVVGTAIGAIAGTIIPKITQAFSFLTSGGAPEDQKKQGGWMGIPVWGWVVISIVLLIFIGPLSFLGGGMSSVDTTRRSALIDPVVQGGGFGSGGPIINCEVNPSDPLCTFTPCDPATKECGWPTSGTITQGPYSTCGGTHRSANAIDLAGNDGAPVYATAKGTVVFTYAGCEDNKGKGGNLCGATGYKGYGNVVVIDRDAGGTLVFGHLSQQSVLLLQNTLEKNGSNKVEATTQIGRVDHNGNSTGAHLHFEYKSSENINNILPIGPNETIKSPIPGCIAGYPGCPACPPERVGGTP